MFLGLKLSLRGEQTLSGVAPVPYYYLRSDNSGFTFLQPGTNFKYTRPQ